MHIFIFVQKDLKPCYQAFHFVDRPQFFLCLPAPEPLQTPHSAVLSITVHALIEMRILVTDTEQFRC